MTPRQIWALYTEHLNEQAAVARIWLAQLAQASGGQAAPRMPNLPKMRN